MFQLFHFSICFPLLWRTTEDPNALGDDSSFFAVTQQQRRACIRRMLRCKLARILPPSSVNPRLASGAFAVAEDESRDRFIGDRRSLNCRERSTGRAHLPNCPRQRLLILRKIQTVQTTFRDTKDCFYLYEVPPSRVRKQVIGPRIPRSWLEHLDDETWDVVDPESLVLQDLIETCASFEPVSELEYCQTGMIAIVMGDVNAVCTLECCCSLHSR